MKKIFLFAVFTSLIIDNSFAMPRESGGMQDSAAIIIEFIDIGAGIDREVQQYVRDMTSTLDANRELRDFQVTHLQYGGEKICFHIKDYWQFREVADQLEAMISQSKSHQRPAISYDSNCSGKNESPFELKH